MINLLSNAIKFSSEESTIEVIVNQHVEEQEGSEQSILLSVIDEGVGIPEDQLESVFDQFEQSSKTRSDSGGTGLGLAIVKEMVQLHRGKVWAESPPADKETGAAIHIILPVEQKGG